MNPPRDLEKSIQDAFDGNLDDAQAQQLRNTLKTCPEALEQYGQHAILETELRRHASGHQNLAAQATSPPRFSSRRFRSILAAAATLAILATVATFSFQYATLAKLEITPGSTLTGLPSSSSRPLPLRRHQVISLEQGVVRLNFPSGIEAVIEGPATFSLESPQSLHLTSGNSWFRIPKASRKLRIVTPWMEITSHQAELAIDQREDRKPLLHAIQGPIHAISQIGLKKAIRIDSDEAVTLSTSGNWELPGKDDGQFRNGLPKSLPVLRMNFDQLRQDTLTIEGDMLGARQAQARVVHPERIRLVPGVAGQAMEFKGDGAYIETTWEGISGTAPRTVSLWCRIPKGTRQQTAPPLAWWGNPAIGWNRKFKVALFTEPGGKTILRASFGEHYINGITPLADGEWHHLAVIYQSNKEDGLPNLTCYIDGKKEEFSATEPGPGRIDTDTFSPSSGCLTIGRYELDERGRNPYLNATIDELQIFAGALDEEAIRRLATPP